MCVECSKAKPKSRRWHMWAGGWPPRTPHALQDCALWTDSTPPIAIAYTYPTLIPKPNPAEGPRAQVHY